MTRPSTRVKICGAVSRADIALLAEAGIDYAGLWHGTGGGRAELPLERVRELAAAASPATPAPVLVTFLNDSGTLSAALARTGVTTVQLHGYQPPSLVRALKRGDPQLTVIKVLHVRGKQGGGGDCAERPLIKAYVRAGTDLFIFDTATEDGRVGSTGQPIDAEVVAGVARELTRPFLLAGGVRADNRSEFAAACASPGFHGVDVDSGARAADGTFDPGRIRALREAWHA